MTIAPSTRETYVATWGTLAKQPSHFMSVQVGPVTPAGLRPNKLLPRLTKVLGPVTVAPGIKAYNSLSAYGTTAGGRGSPRFTDKSHLVQVTVLSASENVLSALEAVAGAIASKL